MKDVIKELCEVLSLDRLAWMSKVSGPWTIDKGNLADLENGGPTLCSRCTSVGGIQTLI